MSNDLNALEREVIGWAKARHIVDEFGPVQATPAGQYLKTVEEVGELGKALIERDFADTQDALGDIVITLIIQANMQGTTLGECLRSAYNEIEHRTGQMINGVYVKDTK